MNNHTVDSPNLKELKQITEYIEVLGCFDANASVVDVLREVACVFLTKRERFKLTMKILRDTIKY